VSGPAITERFPPTALVGVGAISVQFGAALATRLFTKVGPAGAVTLRLAIAAVVLLGGAAFARRRRPGKHSSARSSSDIVVVIAFGVVLAAMNLSFYEAIDRIPLGVAVTLEFWGPMALALVGSRTWGHALWALTAGAGVALLATDTGAALDPVGVAMALLAGAFWIAYILLGTQTGRRFDTLTGLGSAMSVGALLVLPIGIRIAGSSLIRPDVLALGTVVAVLSSAIPYSLEITALRRVSPRAFGVLMSLDPAVAALAGWLVLGEHLIGREWMALGLVVLANLGNALTSPVGPGRRVEPSTSP
jgi:inner membrane transporter RhtA